ncbi:hypothetical protein B0H11DRAFT_1910453 [Mycena galericulata]|nr:hypothetical protein B0H11DRAFT_1910453 [Mycena galericulata]
MVDIAYSGALFGAVELGLPDGLSLVFARAVFETCLSNKGSNTVLQGRRHAHVRRAHPHSRERITRAPVSLGYTREQHNTIRHRLSWRAREDIWGDPHPRARAHERQHRRRPRQLLPQRSRQEAPPWCVGTRRSRSAGSAACGVMHMAVPTLVTIPSRELDITYFPDYTVLTYPEVAPLRPFKPTPSLSIPPQPWVDVNVDLQIMYSPQPLERGPWFMPFPELD